MPLDANKLRHVIDIEQRTDAQDEDSGALTPAWSIAFADVRAQIRPLSAREFTQSAREQSAIVSEVTIWFRPGLRADQRIRHGHKCCTGVGVEILNPAAMLRDQASGLEYVTMPCTSGVDEG